MKTTILSCLIFGCALSAYSQVSPYGNAEQFLRKKNTPYEDFRNYKFPEKFPGSLSSPEQYDFNKAPLSPMPNKFTDRLYSGSNYMPCVHPKTGDDMPCYKPQGAFPMRVFKPENVIWGILW